MWKKVGVFVVGVALAGSGVLWAAEIPVAVSPGSPTGARIGDACPTFSWGAVDGAKSYELVAYRLGEETDEAKPVLRQRVTGSASSWTPSLESCLERGRQYAWSVRADGPKEPSDWSAPSLFEVAAGPSEAEFEAALSVVRQFLGERSGAEGEEDTESETAGDSSPQPPSSPTPRAVGPTQLSVDGGVVATSFTGDLECLDCIDGDEIAANAVGSEEIAAGAVDSSEISAGAVDTSEIAAGAVTGVKIDDAAVGHTKLRIFSWVVETDTGSGPPYTEEVQCPTGTIAVSGGCDVDGCSKMHTVDTHPITSTSGDGVGGTAAGWRCLWNTSTSPLPSCHSSATYKAYVWCLNP